uniref:Uncharacterized protein n=1 Tax=Lactuca sativa TaxID=4236 RepID=A0A9R1WUC7_LACSA|nr:hypothetical protein LSAT_V11C900503250 [Lactuca sativa]
MKKVITDDDLEALVSDQAFQTQVAWKLGEVLVKTVKRLDNLGIHKRMFHKLINLCLESSYRFTWSPSVTSNPGDMDLKFGTLNPTGKDQIRGKSSSSSCDSLRRSRVWDMSNFSLSVQQSRGRPCGCSQGIMTLRGFPRREDHVGIPMADKDHVGVPVAFGVRPGRVSRASLFVECMAYVIYVAYGQFDTCYVVCVSDMLWGTH